MITFLRLKRGRQGFRLSKKDNPRRIVRTKERATLHFASHIDMVFLFNGPLSYWSNAKGSAKGEEGWLHNLHFQQSSRDRYVDLVQGDNSITTWQNFLEQRQFSWEKFKANGHNLWWCLGCLWKVICQLIFSLMYQFHLYVFFFLEQNLYVVIG